MKVAVLYLRILKKFWPDWVEPLPYEKSTRRFLDTYQQWKPKLAHDLIIANCGSAAHDGMFNNVATAHAYTNSGGYDCGTYQEAALGLEDYDFILGLNTHTHFWNNFWLERFVSAFEKFGSGIYGASGSYERNRHLRMPVIAFTPEIMRKYPETIDTRSKAESFECGPENLTIWAQSQGYPTIVVASETDYQLHEIRQIENGFRRGSQQNCPIWDRHMDVFRDASPEERARLTGLVYDAAP